LIVAVAPTRTLSPAWLPAAATRALAGPGVRGAVLIQRDRVVFERYRSGADPAQPQPVNSVTKSVLGMLVGIALRRGELADLDQRLDAFLPEACEQGVPEGVRALTLWHLMSMTTGVEWDEHQVDDCLLHACTRLDGDGERLRFILGRDLVTPPGERFQYDSHGAHLLAVVLTRAVGMPIDDYARQHLFQPIGIRNFSWERDEAGVPFGGRGLALATRDLARLGCLMLHGGRWHGQQILPREYVQRVTRRYRTGGFPLDDTLGYGGLWWTQSESEADADGSFFAFGFGEQLLAVDPLRDLVLAVTANSDKHPKHVREAWAALQHALDEQAA
jgi:CubicO group peptidase (beta-lactamase class C family)